jgi:D-alanyl-D-alanine carboxypeptidase
MTEEQGPIVDLSTPGDQTPTAASGPAAASPYADQHNFSGRVYAFVGALGVTGLVVLASTATWIDRSDTPQVAHPLVATEQVAFPRPPSVPNPFVQLSLEGRSAVVYDIARDRELFSMDSRRPMALASLTKLMTGLVAAETLRPGQAIVIGDNAIQTEGDSGLFAFETWNWKDLLSFTMMTSSNDGADALAAAAGSAWVQSTEPVYEYEKVDAFVHQMNKRAVQLSLSGTSFNNATGLDEGYANGGAVGTASDVARLVGYVWEHEPQVLDYTTTEQAQFASEDGFTHSATNTNEHVAEVPGLLGSKTGYTTMAGGNLAIVFDAGLNHPIAVVVLGSTLEGRFEDVDMLVSATYDYIASGWYDYELAGSTPRS